MNDPYDVLGLKRDASDADIRARFRTLAKEHHPDLNPGKPETEARFKDMSAAYELLSDPAKRARFDRGEIDASGAERPPERRFYRDFGDDQARAKYSAADGFSDDDLQSLFGRGFGRRGGASFKARGGDARYALSVAFLDAANGAVRRLTLPDGAALDVTIPAGVREGQVMRLAGKGHAGFNGGPAGDALIEIAVEPHPFFRRQGDDIIIEAPVSLKEAVLGAKIEVPTIKGPVSVSVPPRSTTGARLRLKGRGIGDGNQFVELKVMTPTDSEPELEDFLKSWTPRQSDDPRRGVGSP